MLPVSSYEDLLTRVRNLTTETIQLHNEITSSLSSCPELMEPITNTGSENSTQRCSCGPSESRSKINDEVTSSEINHKMCDREELYDEFLRQEDSIFLEDDGYMAQRDDVSNLSDFEKKLLKNNFVEDATTENLNAITNLDYMNQNFINAVVSDYDKKEKIKSKSSEFDSLNGDRLKPTRPTSLFARKEDKADIELKEIEEKPPLPSVSSSSEIIFHRKKWGPESLGLWHSGPSSLCLGQLTDDTVLNKNSSSDSSFTSSINFGSHSINGFSSSRTYSQQQLGAKVEMVYNLLSMLGTNNREDMSKTFLAMSSSPESCHAMRQSGCLPLLIQLIHSHELDVEVRGRAAEALYNIVHAQTDDKRRRREIRVLKLLQQVRKYCEELKIISKQEQSLRSGDYIEKHPTNAVGALMKFSFDAEHRQAICTLGGLHAITELIQLDVETHGSSNDEISCITLRRYAGMSLTNLTFGDGKNKALLCGFIKFMGALVEQLKSPSEDLRQVTASVLRNLSWRADSESKHALRDVGAVSALTVAAMEAKKESTLKSILSALWNLSAHCTVNKVEICSVPGSLAFLVRMLKYKSTTNTLAVVENAGGIIRNISSHLAVREDYRQILRDNNCFEILLEHLKSPSLTIVSNACGTLWNLSARCSEDQKRLWEMGATSMLRSLVQSKHKMISMGSSAALKNLLTANPNGNYLAHFDSNSKNIGLQNLPTLFVRKQRALEQELDITLSETCDNIEPSSSPYHLEITEKKVNDKKPPKRSESHESIRSAQSDSACERINQIILKSENLLENKSITLHDSLNEKEPAGKIEDQKLMKRYTASMIPTLALKKINHERPNEKDKDKNPADENDNEPLRDHSEVGLRIDARTEGSNFLEVSSDLKNTAGYSRQTNTTLEFSQAANCISSERIMSNGILKIYSTESLCNANDSKSENNNCKTSLGKKQSDDSKESFMHSNLEKNENELKTVPEFKDSVFHENILPCVNISAQKNRSDVHTESEFQKLPLRSATKSALNLFNLMESENESIEKTSRGFMCLSQSEVNLHDKIDVSENAIASCAAMNQSFETNEKDLKILKLDLGKAQVKAGQVKSPSKKFNEVNSTHEGNNETLSCIKSAWLKDSPLISHTNDGTEQLSSICEINNLEKSDSIPNFKVGLEISEYKFLQSEANKICSEIRKYQEMDMGCSITSEVSLVSCSSFLDAADYSLFDFSSTTDHFNESENKNENKSQIRLKNTGIQKALEDECTDVQSLGSLKKDQGNWEMDLENSIVSVASISSEIAETFTKDKNCCNTYTKTKKYNVSCEDPDFTLEDSVDNSNKDETLNEDTLENNMEFFDEDNSLNSQENLPVDLESCKKLTMVNLDKKLTPKEKRKVVQERYRTYTIRDLKANGDAGDFPLNSESEKSKVKTLQKNSNKFNCGRTLGSGKHQGDVCANNDSMSIKDSMDIGPAERKELVDNAKMVAFSLKNAIQDFDSEASLISDLETEVPCSSHAIDTTTYTKNSECYSDYKLCEDEFKKSNAEYLYGVEENPEKRGPKISKGDPKVEDLKIKEGSKGIRGRKKQLYSSPHRKIGNEIRSTPSSPKIWHTTTDSPSFNLTTTKSLPNVPKSIPSHFVPPVLHREGTFTKEDGSSSKKNTTKNIKTIPVLNKFTDSKFIDSIGTTNRNKSMPSLKTCTSASSAYKIRPLSATVMTNNGPGTRTVGSASDLIVKRCSSSTPPFQGMKSSSSNQSIKNISSERSAFTVKLRNSASQSLQGKPKTPKKEITSKIACLWKKVEDAKQKSKTGEDKRVWIGPENDTKIADQILVLEQEEILDIPTGKIIQSSTVQGLTVSVPNPKDNVKLRVNMPRPGGAEREQGVNVIDTGTKRDVRFADFEEEWDFLA